MPKTDNFYLKQALFQAQKAVAKKQWPVGCVLVYQGKIIARAYNQSHTRKSKLDHAETIALKRQDSFLREHPQEVTLYSTNEPCPMCIGACLVYKIKRIVTVATPDDSGGVFLIKHLPPFYRQLKFKLQVDYVKGTIADQCCQLFTANRPRK